MGFSEPATACRATSLRGPEKIWVLRWAIHSSRPNRVRSACNPVGSKDQGNRAAFEGGDDDAVMRRCGEPPYTGQLRTRQACRAGEFPLASRTSAIRSGKPWRERRWAFPEAVVRDGFSGSLRVGGQVYWSSTVSHSPGTTARAPRRLWQLHRRRSGGCRVVADSADSRRTLRLDCWGFGVEWVQ